MSNIKSRDENSNVSKGVIRENKCLTIKTHYTVPTTAELRAEVLKKCHLMKSTPLKFNSLQL